jgi:hypothetical protein
VHCVGYVYILDLINARQMERIKTLQDIAQGLERGLPDVVIRESGSICHRGMNEQVRN